MNVSKILRNMTWVFLTAMAIQAFFFKIPYCIVIGSFLILTSLLFFPWLDKICNSLNIKMSGKNKWFIGILNLFIAAYLITPEEASYYKCALPITLMILVWVITIIYLRYKIKK